VLATNSEIPGVLWNLALLSEKEGRAEEAEELLTRLVKAQPDWEDAAFRLGFLQLQRGEFAGAVDSFEICLKKDQNWMEALLNLGLACWKFEDLETAEKTFARALTLQPSSPDAIRALAAIAIERKDHTQALDLHRKLTGLGQPSVEVAYNVGLLLQSAGENGAAAECYQIAVDKNPGFTDALLNLGHALKAVGKEDEARAAWSRAVTSDPALAGQYFN
jgi:tetratricopeptide (TPR) repeat protein